jgi:RNA polymerase sigma-70 factor (ECF subfamily)
MLQDSSLAEDASQQVWSEVIAALPSFRGDAKISTWIYRIACRVAVDLARNERIYSTRYLHDYFRDGEIDLPHYQDFDKELWVREMCDKCLTGMLHCLDNETRLMYILRDIVHLSYEEIARVIGKDEPTIRQMFSRARRKLRRFLDNECVLFNPRGTCHCRMKRWVEEIDLPGEYEKLRKLAWSATVFRDSETVLPGKNYWSAYL